MTYLWLFVVSLIAATLLPAQSEAMLVALLLDGGSVVGLTMVASFGNVLGSLINWWIGREALRAVLPLLVVAKTARYAVIAWATLAIAS
ncbi:hypothetical protein MUG10_21635 [Xanthomonas prunicola]|uniref:DedA family protein n=1 Tax=Xanthomonas prunicola TaxID=2053930 RepID=A0A9Q9MSN0_9XANT|nr:hypothetical protein [Xanthomonas prunicola]USJ00476.1 hypothetical protein MUG10_21635 [Xanthomonas prunicola]UXA49030.1 hypothetical protein M0D44_00075 [Xanthomonas prunicola]UXA53220.1 hypothetical protein M0D45_21945 [Xanthomonas prunicola]UXA57332.1 hypothetical protein M0D47_00085 [Xanthomonas prunicola]UXA63286.1 hypothetical protein M0D48_10390 [Xanthomonas prunicola]